MKSTLSFFVIAAFGILLLLPADVHAAGLVDRVPEAFTHAFGRQPTAAEKTYWTLRVSGKEKTTFDALLGAMYFAKSKGQAAPAAAAISDKQILIKAVLTEFIRIYGSNPTEAEKAWWRKRIACGEIKNMKALTSSMQFHKAKKVRKGSDAICGAKATSVATASGVTRRAVAGISNHPMGDEVRIGIFKTDGAGIKVTSNGKFQVREGASKILATADDGKEVTVSWSGGKYHVRGAGLSFDTAGKIRLVPLNQAIMQIKSYSDPSASYPGKNYNRFRGVIEIRKCDGCNELWAINELRTEYYVRGLGETSGTGPEEYMKALGTAARTYVLYHKVVTGGRKAKQDFDIGSTADDQIYRGYEYEIIVPRFVTAVDKTRGVIVTNSEGDIPASTVYFSDSDGRTRSAKEAWNSSRFPHLQSVNDPHHASNSCKGHCVGMSAQGAYGFANKDNWSFQKILTYYYKGVKLVKAY